MTILGKFFPRDKQDHLTLCVTMRVKIGVDDAENGNPEKSFLEELKVLLGVTGGVAEDVNLTIFKTDPYVGSQREKIWHDTEIERNTRFESSGDKEEVTWGAI